MIQKRLGNVLRPINNCVRIDTELANRLPGLLEILHFLGDLAINHHALVLDSSQHALEQGLCAK